MFAGFMASGLSHGPGSKMSSRMLAISQSQGCRGRSGSRGVVAAAVVGDGHESTLEKSICFCGQDRLPEPGWISSCDVV